MFRLRWMVSAMCASLLLGSGCTRCGGSGEQAAQPQERPKSKQKAKTKKPEKGKKAAKTGKGKAASEIAERAPTVMVFVLDTVRADHMGVCGYKRPNTPNLSELRESGVVVGTCNARVPADWTLPSHASLMTGLEVAEHCAVISGESDIELNPYTTVRPLAEEYETLAETFKARGYQTVAISGNPIVSVESGLMQGFDWVKTKPPAKLRGEGLAEELTVMLGELDRTKPLFLFVNIFDAHDPYPAVPKGVAWNSRQLELSLPIHGESGRKDEDSRARDYLEESLSESSEADFLTEVVNGYDWAIYQADKSFGLVKTAVERRGWLAGEWRAVITSDHGEFLGEHRLLRHGGYLWEPNNRVFVMYGDHKKSEIEFPTPFAMIDAYHLALDGKLPETPSRPVALGFENPSAKYLPGFDAVALWDGDEKLMWREEGKTIYNLVSDPDEVDGQPLGNHALARELDDLVRAGKACAKRPLPDAAALSEMLIELGYADRVEAEPTE